MDDFLDFLYEFVLPIVVIVGGVCAFSGGITLGVVKWQHSLDRTACQVFSEQSGRETKFVDYNWASWDCLTPQSDGKWISTSYLREV